jgi:ABC-type ATPase involved in cell division
MSDEVLTLENISYGSTEAAPLINRISLRLCRGEVLWIVGPPGSGKTTLLEILIKEKKPSSGKGYFLKQPLFRKISLSRQRLRRQISVICQQDSLFPHRTVIENVILPMKIAGVDSQASRLRASEAIRQVGLVGKIQAQVATLTPNESRIVTLAQALAKLPPLILADLNSCEFDQKVIVQHLLRASTYGSAVIFFSRQRPQEVPLLRSNMEVSLA